MIVGMADKTGMAIDARDVLESPFSLWFKTVDPQMGG